jgi:tRNA nucleotidyltransferase (CCA-adding enzyme)
VPYEHFAHTADLGLRVTAGDLNQLFREAAEGLVAMIAERVDPHPSDRERRWRIAGTRPDHLLLDWLNELLFAFDVERVLLHGFDVVVDRDGLAARALAQPLDEARHVLLREVKAITYHELRLERGPDGWLAEVIVDI